MSQPASPVEQFGNIDVYLFDQILRERVTPGMRVLDVGCGRGRNLRYFLSAGYDVAGCDRDSDAIQAVQGLARELGIALPADRFRAEAVEDCSFEEGSFDFVICNAVLHFAEDDAHMRAMLAGAWRPLKIGGVFFARLASTIGIEDRVQSLGDRRFALPDGTERYLVDEALLVDVTKQLGAELIDPIKTTNVQNQRCMTTWVLRRLA